MVVSSPTSQAMPEVTSQRSLVELPSGGATVRGWLFEPGSSAPPHPAIAMIHGFSATATGMGADCLAERFADAGVAALVIDPLTFGMSDGEPRRQIDRWQQARDYMAAITYLTAHEAVDAERVAVWGDSLSGGIALVVAAVDSRVAAVAVQVPGLGDELSPSDSDGSRFRAIRDIVLDSDLSSFGRTLEGPMPVVSPDQQSLPSHLKPITAFRWFLTYGALHGTKWENEATWVEVDTPTPFDAQLCAPHISVPTVMVIAEEDEMPGADVSVARAVYDSLPGPKELAVVGGGHFGLLYLDSHDHELAASAQVAFLGRHLNVALA